MAELFRLVKYDNLPIFNMHVYIYIYVYVFTYMDVFICGIASSCRSIEHFQPPNPLTSIPTRIYQRVYIYMLNMIHTYIYIYVYIYIYISINHILNICFKKKSLTFVSPFLRNLVLHDLS